METKTRLRPRGSGRGRKRKFTRLVKSLGSSQIHGRDRSRRCGRFDIAGLRPKGRRVPRSCGPAVGSVVRGPVRELRLFFTLGVVIQLFGIQVTSLAGAPVAAARRVSHPADLRIVIIRFNHSLPPGTYEVSTAA
jgi:hypothetical protein